jgi:isoleucyl-tRNA synthetase
VWLERFPDVDGSVHLQLFPETPEGWRDTALAAKMARIVQARRVVLGALEIERREKRVGASLEAAPTLHIADPETRAACKGADMADLCITSGLTISADPAPDAAFRLPEIDGVAAVPARAQGSKCARCWKVTPDVGSHAHAGVCARCDAALGEGR